MLSRHIRRQREVFKKRRAINDNVRKEYEKGFNSLTIKDESSSKSTT